MRYCEVKSIDEVNARILDGWKVIRMDKKEGQVIVYMTKNK